MAELGRIDDAGELDEMLKLTAKQSRLKAKFEESVRSAEALLADLLFELIMPMWTQLRKLTKKQPPAAGGASGGLHGEPVPPADPGG